MDFLLRLSLEHLLDVGVVKGHGGADDDEEHAAHGPHVVHLRVVGLSAENLRRCVGGAPAVRPRQHAAPRLLIRTKPCKSKVGDFDAIVPGHEQILAFEVAMNDVDGMNVGDAAADVLEELLGIGIRLSAVFLDVTE